MVAVTTDNTRSRHVDIDTEPTTLSIARSCRQYQFNAGTSHVILPMFYLQRGADITASKYANDPSVY